MLKKAHAKAEKDLAEYKKAHPEAIRSFDARMLSISKKSATESVEAFKDFLKLRTENKENKAEEYRSFAEYEIAYNKWKKNPTPINRVELEKVRRKPKKPF